MEKSGSSVFVRDARWLSAERGEHEVIQMNYEYIINFIIPNKLHIFSGRTFTAYKYVVGGRRSSRAI
jgi:hypothetical protein